MARIEWLMPKSELYPLIHEMADGTVRDEAREIKVKAERNLAIARATTGWTKLPEPMVRRQQASGLTDISLDKEFVKYGNDYLVTLEGGEDNAAALAIEMGHWPSGYFAGSASKSPGGLYILTRAAGLTVLGLMGRQQRRASRKKARKKGRK